MARLGTQLHQFHAGLISRITPAEAECLTRTQAALAASDVADHALRPGDAVPDATLTDQHGHAVHLHDLLGEGPAALVFYRGGWSPLCELTLRGWQDAQRALRRAGIHVAAIGPDQPHEAADVAARNHLSYPVLSDGDLAVAEAFGLAYQMPREMQRLYARFSPGQCKSCGIWRVPLTATYVVGADGLVRHAHIDARPQIRLDPQDAMALLRPATQAA